MISPTNYGTDEKITTLNTLNINSEEWSQDLDDTKISENVFQRNHLRKFLYKSPKLDN